MDAVAIQLMHDYEGNSYVQRVYLQYIPLQYSAMADVVVKVSTHNDARGFLHELGYILTAYHHQGTPLHSFHSQHPSVAKLSKMLSDDEVRDLIKLKCSFIPSVVSLQRSGEGGDHQAWIINDTFVLRTRDDEDGYEVLQRERLLLESLTSAATATGLDQGIIPSCFVTEQHQGTAFGVYEKIRGKSVEDVPEAVNQHTEEGLVSVLYLLQKISLNEAKTLKLEDEDPVDIPRLRKEALVAWERLIANEQWPHHPKLDQLLSLDETLPAEDPSMIQHADLKGEHIFVDPDTGALTGIIDWSDACIGHPSVDIGGIAISIGAAAAMRIGRQAGYSHKTIQCGLVVGRCNAILLLDETLNVGTDCPVWLLKKQLQRVLQT